MRHPFRHDIRGPLVPRAGIILGAAGRQDSRCPLDPALCRESPAPLPGAGGCPCGSVPRPL